MATVDLNLKPGPGVSRAPPVRFTFDTETQTFDGPDGAMVADVAAQLKAAGSVGVIPCYSHPLGDRLSLEDLAAILSSYWDLRDSGLPIIDIPEDPDMPEGAVF